ncbi:hypothetical protein [Synechocystis sp. LKSZ1]|uniref:hypothetical protein n=1 Tax=Synechocystis sp. LKSZ1 TaxID=3144951 RepID=UPI00336BF6A9
MRKSLIGYSLIFVATLSLLTLLFGFQTVVFPAGIRVTLLVALAPLVMVLPCGLASRIILANYEKRQWRVNWVSTGAGGAASFFYSAFIAGLINAPDSLSSLLIVLSVSLGAIVGIFAASLGALGLSGGLIIVILGTSLIQDNPRLLAMTTASSFCVGLLLLSGLMSYVIFFGKPQAFQKQAFSQRFDAGGLLDLDTLTLALLGLAKQQKKALTKAEIMVELQISATTADTLLKEAEINQLCSVELDQRDGTLRYRFPVE